LADGRTHARAQLLKKFKDEEKSMANEISKAKTSSLKRGAAGPFNAEGATAGQLLDEAQGIQAKDLEATKRMQRQLAQTEEVASATMVELQTQTDQIGKIHQDLEEIDDTLKLATTELRAYMRRIATDKLILGFVAMIMIGIFVIIILNVVGVIDDEDVNTPDIDADVDNFR
jgi:SNARE protein